MEAMKGFQNLAGMADSAVADSTDFQPVVANYSETVKLYSSFAEGSLSGLKTTW